MVSCQMLLYGESMNSANFKINADCEIMFRALLLSTIILSWYL